jgi:signal transduction histidine kinase
MTVNALMGLFII